MAAHHLGIVDERLELRELSHGLLSKFLFHTRSRIGRPTTKLANAGYANFIPQPRSVHVLITNDTRWQVFRLERRLRGRRLQDFLGTHRHGIAFEWVYRSVHIHLRQDVGRPRPRGDEHLCIVGDVDDTSIGFELRYAALLRYVISAWTSSDNVLYGGIVKEGNVQVRIPRASLRKLLRETLGARGARFVFELGTRRFVPLMKKTRFSRSDVIAI
mmetsp:Transcript_13653/g.28989  ORF Transcript_13653/g.28989 Transcript_13653/m.28989 type:complete len:215 (-) Transcript_13653:298-942(-)